MARLSMLLTLPLIWACKGGAPQGENKNALSSSTTPAANEPAPEASTEQNSGKAPAKLSLREEFISKANFAATEKLGGLGLNQGQIGLIVESPAALQFRLQDQASSAQDPAAELNAAIQEFVGKTLGNLPESGINQEQTLAAIGALTGSAVGVLADGEFSVPVPTEALQNAAGAGLNAAAANLDEAGLSAELMAAGVESLIQGVMSAAPDLGAQPGAEADVAANLELFSKALLSGLPEAGVSDEAMASLVGATTAAMVEHITLAGVDANAFAENDAFLDAIIHGSMEAVAAMITDPTLLADVSGAVTEGVGEGAFALPNISMDAWSSIMNSSVSSVLGEVATFDIADEHLASFVTMTSSSASEVFATMYQGQVDAELMGSFSKNLAASTGESLALFSLEDDALQSIMGAIPDALMGGFADAAELSQGAFAFSPAMASSVASGMTGGLTLALTAMIGMDESDFFVSMSAAMNASVLATSADFVTDPEAYGALMKGTAASMLDAMSFMDGIDASVLGEAVELSSAKALETAQMYGGFGASMLEDFATQFAAGATQFAAGTSAFGGDFLDTITMASQAGVDMAAGNLAASGITIDTSAVTSAIAEVSQQSASLSLAIQQCYMTAGKYWDYMTSACVEQQGLIGSFLPESSCSAEPCQSSSGGEAASSSTGEESTPDSSSLNCPNGYHLENNICMPDSSTPSCSEGEHLEGSTCVPHSSSSYPSSSYPSSSIDPNYSSNTSTSSSGSSSSCTTGEYYYNGGCIPMTSMPNMP